jgi:hypothetical protein
MIKRYGDSGRRRIESTAGADSDCKSQKRKRSCTLRKKFDIEPMLMSSPPHRRVRVGEEEKEEHHLPT